MADGDDGGQDEAALPSLVAEDVQVVRSGGRLKWIAAFVGAVAVIAGVLVVAGRADDIDADEALEQAQEIVEGSESYRFELLEARRTETGDPDGAGSETTTRYLTEGTVVDADHWRTVSRDGMDEEHVYETVRDGDTGYTTNMLPFGGDSDVDVPEFVAGPIDHEPTVEELVEMYAYLPDDFTDEDPQYAAEMRLDLAMLGYLLPVADDPQHVRRLVLDATDPVVEEELVDGGLRVRARLAPLPEVAEASDEPIPPVDLLLDLDRDRRPVSARFKAAVEGASQDVEVRYRDWGAELSVEIPAESEVDQTPWITEEQLAAHPEVLVAPTALPEGWALTNAMSMGGPPMAFAGMPPVEEDEADACRTLELMYGSGEELTFDYEGATEEELDAFYEELDVLSVSATTAECAGEGLAEGGGFSVLGTSDDEVDVRQVTVEDVVVTIHSTLEPAEVDLIAGSLRRVTVEELSAMFPPEVREQQAPFHLGGPFG